MNLIKRNVDDAKGFLLWPGIQVVFKEDPSKHREMSLRPKSNVTSCNHNIIVTIVDNKNGSTKVCYKWTFCEDIGIPTSFGQFVHHLRFII